ncbi:MAG: SIS domain-containing protein [Verrucomicrobia bacterium]|nr:SIS domain-containing protein [Verrucomicrobiota bacterium]
MNFSKIIHDQLEGHFAAVEKLRAQTGFIEDLARRVIAALEAGKKIIFFGNGGSAADAQHLAAEFVVRYRRNRRALPAISLSTDTSILTAGGNDFGFESIYARQIEALAVTGDIAIGISTSGNSANVIAALQAAKDKGCVTVAFTGSAQCRCSQLAEITFHAPSEITAHIQECHIVLGHILCELVETHVIDG